MEDDAFKEVVLKKHDIFGFGFSIIGGYGGDSPVLICDILDGSPADVCKEC